MRATMRPGIDDVVDALRSAARTLEPAERRVALTLYRLLLAGSPVGVADLALAAGVDAESMPSAAVGGGLSASRIGA